MRTVLACIFLVVWLISASTVSSQVVVNEVLANEPGSARLLEWIELYNGSPGSVELDNRHLIVDEDTILLSGSIASNSYLIVCRQLIASDGSASFEGFWGDSSGIWGDTPSEVAIPTPVEASFSLTNTSGSVRLERDGILESELSWSQSGGDGHSWERVDPLSAAIAQSVAVNGSTPGEPNSVVIMDYDLAVEEVALQFHGLEAVVEIRIRNRGREAIHNGVAELYISNQDQSRKDLIETWVLPVLLPDAFTTLVWRVALESQIAHYVVCLGPDDRESNNHRRFILPGQDFPPLVITEFLANPTSGYSGEWVEVMNRSSGSENLLGWSVGDERGLATPIDTSISISPGERVALVKEYAAFVAVYGFAVAPVIECRSWQYLNNSSDTVRLIDPNGLEADRIGYDLLYGNNHTWSRGETGEYGAQWGRSEDPGGSPGRPNRVIFDGGKSTLLRIEPRVFSPDGDGFQDSCLISVSGPDLSGFDLCIYDRNGRMVRDLRTGAYRSNQYGWTGTDDSRRRLPVGIYVVFCRAGEGSVAKKTVVIAR